MRKFTIKSLLIAAALCLGTSAWAQETTTLCEYGTTENPWTETNLTDFTGNAITLSDYGAYYTASNNGGDASTKIIAPAENSIINVDAYWYGMSNTGRYFSNSNGIYFRFGNVFVAQSDQDKKHGYGFNGIANMSSVTTFTGTNGYRDYDISTKKFLHIEMEINTATNTLVYFKVSEEGSESYLVNVENILLDTPDYTTIEWGYKKGSSVGNQRHEYLKSIKVTQTTQEVATKQYTINYKFEDNTIHTVSGELAVGATVNTESVITDDGVKYLSVNDAQEFEITADGTNTWDVEVRKPYTATLQVNTTINDVKAEGEIITFTESDDKVCSWSFGNPLYVLDEDVYCKLTDATLTYLSGTFTNGEEIVKELVYESANSVLYFAEFENSQEAGSSYPVSNVAGFSNGKGKAIMKTDQTMTQTFTVSDAGIYTISMPYKNTNNKSRDYKVTVDGVTGETYSIASGASGVYTNELELAKGEHNIVITCTYSLTPVFDYIVVENTDNGERNVSITSAGYATFSSACAVDFSAAEGLAAYTAKVNEAAKTVTLTKIADGIVPANTGVVLKGEAGDYTGTITTTDAVIDNNDLKASTEAVTGDGSIYVLNKVGDNVGFYPLATGATLAAGKAYLQLTSGAKGYTFVWNDGETTGIEENYEFGTMNSDAATFDLSGRKVANPTKGLYIKDGKKFVVK